MLIKIKLYCSVLFPRGKEFILLSSIVDSGNGMKISLVARTLHYITGTYQVDMSRHTKYIETRIP